MNNGAGLQNQLGFPAPPANPLEFPVPPGHVPGQHVPQLNLNQLGAMVQGFQNPAPPGPGQPGFLAWAEAQLAALGANQAPANGQVPNFQGQGQGQPMQMNNANMQQAPGAIPMNVENTVPQTPIGFPNVPGPVPGQPAPQLNLNQIQAMVQGLQNPNPHPAPGQPFLEWAQQQLNLLGGRRRRRSRRSKSRRGKSRRGRSRRN
jgi:hypothetical protein